MKIKEIHGFDWDDGNISKVQARAPLDEVEGFFNQTLTVKEDRSHSKHELRFIAAGYSRGQKPMFVAFTIREVAGVLKIRVISARYMHKKETRAYEIFKKDSKKS